MKKQNQLGGNNNVQKIFLMYVLPLLDNNLNSIGISASRHLPQQLQIEGDGGAEPS